jgi:hypothetical protein
MSKRAMVVIKKDGGRRMGGTGRRSATCANVQPRSTATRVSKDDAENITTLKRSCSGSNQLAGASRRVEATAEISSLRVAVLLSCNGADVLAEVGDSLARLREGRFSCVGERG